MTTVVPAETMAEGDGQVRRNADLLTQPLTDSGNAERFVKLHGQDVRYCPEYKVWFVWDEKRWRRDTTGRVHRKAKETARRLYTAALSIGDDKQRHSTEQFARLSESAKGLRAMLECARYEVNVPISPNDFDTDPLLFNCKNGTLDLRTGELRAHSRRDLTTKMCAVRYNETAKCPVFLRFLDTIFNQSGDLIAYVQRI